MKTSEKLDKILPKLARVKAELEAVSKSANNPFFKSKYADLNTHLEEVEPRLHKEGLILLQPVNTNPTSGVNTVESCIIDVESGQFVSSEMSLILVKNSPQDAGSSVTYLRRYTLGSLLGMKAEDDDGEKSMGRTPAPVKAATKPVVPTPAAQVSPVVAQVASAVTASTASAVTTTPTAAEKPAKKSTFRKNVKPVPAPANTAAPATAEEDWT